MLQWDYPSLGMSVKLMDLLLSERYVLPASLYDALRPDTADPTIAMIKSKLGATAAPDRRDRVELIGISYHWPNLGLVHGFDHVFGQNPLRFQDFKQATAVGDTVATAEQRRFSPLYPSYRSRFADLFGVRVIATGVPVEQIDKALQPGDLTFLGRTKEAYVYENPRALPRVMVITDWRLADFEELMRTGWPDVDPGRTVLLESPPQMPAAPAAPASQPRPGSARPKMTACCGFWRAAPRSRSRSCSASRHWSSRSYT